MLFVLSKEIRAARTDMGEERQCVSLAVLGPSSPFIITCSWPTASTAEKTEICAVQANHLDNQISVGLIIGLFPILHYEIIGCYLQLPGEQYVPCSESVSQIAPHLRSCRYAGLLRECNHPGSGSGKSLSH